jgi:hypothetical protein
MTQMVRYLINQKHKLRKFDFDLSNKLLESLQLQLPAIEDDIVMLSTYKALRYVKPFIRDVDNWERDISLILEVTEALLTSRSIDTSTSCAKSNTQYWTSRQQLGTRTITSEFQVSGNLSGSERIG